MNEPGKLGAHPATPSMRLPPGEPSTGAAVHVELSAPELSDTVRHRSSRHREPFNFNGLLLPRPPPLPPARV